MRVQQRGRQHGELTAGQGEQHPPGAFQRLVEGPQFVAPLVHEAPQEGLVEVEVPAVGRAQRGLPDQVGELTPAPTRTINACPLCVLDLLVPSQESARTFKEWEYRVPAPFDEVVAQAA